MRVRASQAADELVVIDNLEIFRANGFEIHVDSGSPPTQRLRLVALPFSKHTVFGPSDITEVLLPAATTVAAAARRAPRRDAPALLV